MDDGIDEKWKDYKMRLYYNFIFIKVRLYIKVRSSAKIIYVS